VLAVLFPILASVAAADTPAAEATRFTRAAGSIVIDGRLDERSWSSAQPVSRFFEVYPASVGMPPAETEARLLYDDRNIYIGIRATDPAAGLIRSSLARRDQALDAQDYVEILLDPANTRQNAMLFRTNPHGVQVDGVYDEAARARYYAPDFDFDVRTASDQAGWTAEFRIPLTTLRYVAARSDAWAFAIYRHRPRETAVTMASIPVPRSTGCLLCFAGEARGLELRPRGDAHSLTPHLTLASLDRVPGGASERIRVGVDAKWQPRPDTAIDVTIRPDFSQVEADRPQLTANTRFALSVPEKRPFFLEGLDLFAMPIPAVYTRSFTDPRGGIRITGRGTARDYSALLLRDAGGGIAIEPGPTGSRAVVPDFESTAAVARFERLHGPVSWGALASARLNDDDSKNLVVGFDGQWAPSTSDRVIAQVLGSETVNPNRPDLLSSWIGQRLKGVAGSVEAVHFGDSWYGTLKTQLLSPGFRAWNGFVTQVGAESVRASGGLYFYPRGSMVTRVSPVVSLEETRTTDGSVVSRRVAPAVHIQAVRDTLVTVTWSPNEEGTTPLGLRSFDSLSTMISSTPVAWMPGAGVSFSTGESLDLATGQVGTSRTVQATLPIRLEQLELITSLARQSLESRFTERNVHVNATWHFSTRLYAQGIHQMSSLSTADATTRRELTSLLVSYQTNWQTRYFIGFRQVDGLERDRELFAKISYVFSR
jgi:hypothetical protein